MFASDADERVGLQLVEGVGGGLAVDAEALGDVLVREAVHLVAVGLSQQQRGDAPAYALEDRVFELALGFEDAPPEGFEDAARDLRLRQQEAVEDGAVHRDDGRVFGHLGEGVVHALADAGQLAEE